jgi:hypothetical protein
MHGLGDVWMALVVLEGFHLERRLIENAQCTHDGCSIVLLIMKKTPPKSPTIVMYKVNDHLNSLI